MITEAAGNLLKEQVDALVNTVNTEGVMGKGIALQFKNAFPGMFKDYAVAAKRGEIKLGKMHVWPTHMIDGPQFIINFPTKAHWRSKSKLKDIESGLDDLVRIVKELKIRSIAVPPLGCGNGGLSWSDVEPLIRSAFQRVPEVAVRLYPPAGTPLASEMAVNTQRPELTPGRAALLGIVGRYTQQALDAPSLVETQKLMYFLQLAGEPLNLAFEANRYGPYADNLRHVLSKIEGHFLSGYGDGSARVLEMEPLQVLEGVAPEVERVLQTKPETVRRMDRVLDLATGFESAYGMELLATVHWIASTAPEPVSDDDVVKEVANWSTRKARMFTPEHITYALLALKSRHWLATA